MRNPIGLIIKRLLLLIFFLPAAYFATAQVVGTPYGITTLDCSSAPATPGAITGIPATINLNATFTASVPAVSGATSYIWTLPGGLTGSSTNNSIIITGATASTYAVGAIKCAAVNACGTSETSNSPAAIKVNACSAAPAQPGAISFSATTINLNATFTASVPAVSGATSYAWVLPSGLAGSSATNAITIQGTTAGAKAASGITVTAKNDCGNSAARAGTGTITVIAPNTVMGRSTACSVTSKSSCACPSGQHPANYNDASLYNNPTAQALFLSAPVCWWYLSASNDQNCFWYPGTTPTGWTGGKQTTGYMICLSN